MIQRQLLLFVIIIICFSCKESNKYSYAIKDFRETLQPDLTKIVTKGIVDWDSTLHNMATDEELLKLSKCEHPLLRAAALREMLDRKSFNHFELLMNHLDDTATVPTDAGEFGIWYRTVSDDFLEKAARKDSTAKNKTIDEVLTNHNYLRDAYHILSKIEPQKKYYSIIKNMAMRPRRLDWEGYELGFDDIEYALYGLAKFRKKEDIKIIKEKLMEHVWQLSDISFRLMKEFPDTAYFDIFQTYHRRRFYHLCGNSFYPSNPTDFIDALAVYEDDRSASIIDTIFQRLPLVKCRFDEGYIYDKLVEAIVEHPCLAFTNLNKKYRKQIEAYKKYMIMIDSAFASSPAVDTTAAENIK